MSTPIHWHDGLFLQPHHLQTFQRTVYERLGGNPRLRAPFPYGVIAADCSAEGIARGTVRFDRLHAVLRDGTVYRVPEEGRLPALNISDALRSRPDGFVVGLAVPVWQPKEPNTVPKPPGTVPYEQSVSGQNRNRRYCVHEEDEVVDENDAKRPHPVQFLRLNGRLAFQDEDTDVAEFLPLVRVIPQPSEIRGTSRRLDPRFVPPTLLLAGSPVLLQLVREMADAVAAAYNQLGEQLAGEQENGRQPSFERLSRLRCLTRGGAWLGSLVDDTLDGRRCAGRVPLYDVYLAVQDLLAELSSLDPARRIFSWERYDHDDPYPGFADLDAKIRGFLEPETDHFLRLDFTLERDQFVGDVPPDFFRNITGCYLAIETAESPVSLAQIVADRDQFKLLPTSYLNRIAVRGLTLRGEHGAPVGLRPQAGRYYYRVDEAASGAILWEDFRKSPRVGVHFKAPDLSRYRLSLYVTLPPVRP